MDNDPCKFALTSRTGEVLETFVLHASSPSVRQTWIHEINQILENQRNFLNGTSRLCSLPPRTRAFFPSYPKSATHYKRCRQALDLRSSQLFGCSCAWPCETCICCGMGRLLSPGRCHWSFSLLRHVY